MQKNDNNLEQNNMANNLLGNLDNLSKTNNEAKNEQEKVLGVGDFKKNDNKPFEPKQEENKPTFFMMNNNAPQQQNFEPFLKDLPQYQKNKAPQLTSYGTAALILAIVSFICCSFLLAHIVINPDMSDTSKMDFLFYVFFVILAPSVGLIGGLICSFSSAILGIIALAKSYKRTISWVGFSFSIIALAGFIVLAGFYLLG